MGIFDDLLGQLGNIDELAQKLGLPADTVQTLTAELTEKMQAGGNPLEIVSELASKHGLSLDALQGMLGGGSNPLGDLGGLTKNLFGS